MRRLLLIGALLLTTLAASAREPAPLAASGLPAEARQTLELVKRGGPFPYRRDGVVFGNYEQRLPARGHGYYREFTVPTPGARDRGARRLVAAAGPANDVRSSGEYYYSDDHYRSFHRIVE
jgi:ribonuclease T1